MWQSDEIYDILPILECINSEFSPIKLSPSNPIFPSTIDLRLIMTLCLFKWITNCLTSLVWIRNHRLLPRSPSNVKNSNQNQWRKYLTVSLDQFHRAMAVTRDTGLLLQTVPPHLISATTSILLRMNICKPSITGTLPA